MASSRAPNDGDDGGGDGYRPGFGFFGDLLHPRGDDTDAREDELVDFHQARMDTERQNEVHVNLPAPKPLASTTPKRPEIAVPHPKLPTYLSANYRLFDQTVRPILQKKGIAIDLNHLRNLAFSIQSVGTVRLAIQEWETYLQSGTGQLKQKQPPSSVPPPRLWPKYVTGTMVRHSATAHTDPSKLEHAACLDYTEKYLKNLRYELEQRETRLVNQKHSLTGLTNELVQAIEQYVHRYSLQLTEIQSQVRRTVVEYDYNEQMIDAEFRHTSTHQEQLRLFQALIKAKHQYESSRVEVVMLKERLHYRQLPDFLKALQLPTPMYMNELGSQQVRMAVHHRHQRAIQQAQSEIMAASILAAEARTQEHEDHFEREMYRLEKIQQDPVAEARLTKDMSAIMERYFQSIEERVKRLLELKVDFFVRAPTVVTTNMM